MNFRVVHDGAVFVCPPCVSVSVTSHLTGFISCVCGCCCLARQHKSQFEQLIEAARNNRQKRACEQTAVDDVRSSASSVELITDSETPVNQPVTGDVLYTVLLNICLF